MSTKGLLVVIASLTLGLASDAYASKPVHAACGQTITADTTLNSDLTNCTGPGITIGADDITLDLNGHTITGKGKGVASTTSPATTGSRSRTARSTTSWRALP